MKSVRALKLFDTFLCSGLSWDGIQTKPCEIPGGKSVMQIGGRKVSLRFGLALSLQSLNVCQLWLNSSRTNI